MPTDKIPAEVIGMLQAMEHQAEALNRALGATVLRVPPSSFHEELSLLHIDYIAVASRLRSLTTAAQRAADEAGHHGR